MSYEQDRDAYRVIKEKRSIDEHKKSDRYSKVFRHTCRAWAIYLILWVIAAFLLLIGLVFECLPAIASLVLFLIPTLTKLGCILFLCTIVIVTSEGLR